MKLFNTWMCFTTLGFLIACSETSGNSSDEPLSDTTSVTNEKPKEWFTVQADSLFQIDLPINMSEKKDLNTDASLEYAYMEKVGGVVKEHYVIVMADTKREIESYELSVEFDAMSFSQSALESVVEGYDTYEILTTEPRIETINEMDCVVYEIEAALGDVKTYHMLAVFEGELAFYQILTWTLSDQQSEFKDKMKQMIDSFSEIDLHKSIGATDL
ncbi:MAG: hypothetical protein IPG07_01915 [Crocinitomicaceae bacterium]|nr:hypothetical protein [Crocinitomicaceae bacterium]